MEISKVDKVTPEHGSAAAPPDHFWKLIAPRLLEPLSLGIIQTLIREARPLSAAELAVRLELSVELVREQLSAMAGEGSLVRDSPPAGSSEQEPLYRLAAPMIDASARSTSPYRIVGTPRLSRAGRNALYGELVLDFAQVADLERLAESEDPEDIGECREIGARVLNALRLIHEGGIGWGLSGEADFVELPLAPRELAGLVAHRHQLLTEFVESQKASWERDKREFEDILCARDACGAILDQLRPALAAT
jgi:hypothetical protein